LNLTRTIKVTIYCYKINFIVTSKSRALEKPLIVDQLWHLVRAMSDEDDDDDDDDGYDDDGYGDDG